MPVPKITFLLLFAGLGCSSTIVHVGPQQDDASTADDASPLPDDAVAADATPGPDPLITARPYELKEPKGYDGSKPSPLVIGFHGYGPGDNADAFEAWVQLAPTASVRNYLYALPSGTIDADKNPFWNATDSCCNFYNSKVDDVAYISAVIDDVARTHNLDRKRVYVVGISGGGFMVHRLACDLSDKIAGAMSISGATWKDASKCKPTSPIALVEMHGTADDTVVYDGGNLGGPDFPGALETVDHWRVYQNCTGTLHESGTPLDLETNVPGAETHLQTYDSCGQGDVELWTAQGGPHAPSFTSSFVTTVFDWFDKHPKP